MPHIPSRFKPAPGTLQVRTVAPSAAPTADYGQLDAGLPDTPVQSAKPDVPFAAPRRRARNTLLPTISMQRHAVSVDAVADHLFPPGDEAKDFRFRPPPPPQSQPAFMFPGLQ